MAWNLLSPVVGTAQAVRASVPLLRRKDDLCNLYGSRTTQQGNTPPFISYAKQTSLLRATSEMEIFMHMTIALQPLLALLAGLLILIAPRVLNYVVAIYLIIIGLLGLFPNLMP